MRWSSVRLASPALRTAQRIAFGSCRLRASALRTWSTAVVKIWTTWNQSTVTAALGKLVASEARKAGDMSQTASATLVGSPPWLSMKVRKAATQAFPLPGVAKITGLSARSMSMNTVM